MSYRPWVTNNPRLARLVCLLTMWLPLLVAIALGVRDGARDGWRESRDMWRLVRKGPR